MRIATHRIWFGIFLTITAFGASEARATDWPNGLSERRYAELARQLAGKVNLFREVWRQVPDARFTGGTVRDYLYWLRMELAAAKTPAELDEKVARLRSLPTIDVRAFVHEESDIDYASAQGKKAVLEAEDFGVKKLDAVEGSRFVAGTPAHASELLQGYIPIEKVLLGRSELVTATGFGDGVDEIFRGAPSVRFATDADFARSFYAVAKANHPILLTIRYVRTLSLNHAKTGHALAEYPDLKQLLAGVEPGVQERMREIVERTIAKTELKEYFANHSFAKWYRGTLEKSFRAYVHPTATYLLFRHFGLDRLVQQWPEYSIPINQFAYAKPRLPRHIEEFDRRIREFGFDPADILSSTDQALGATGYLYHGTRGDDAFHDILVRGIVESGSGSAGRGVYGVPEGTQWFAEQWGGSREDLVRFKVAHSARIVDLVAPNPKLTALVDAYKRKTGAPYAYGDDAFADYFGIDAFRYPYEVDAFVVKNAAILGQVEGVYRTVMTFNQAIEAVARIRTPRELVKFSEGIALSRGFTSGEWDAIFASLDAFPGLKDAYRGIDALGLKEIGAAKALVAGMHVMMLGISGGSADAAASRPFVQRLILEPARRLEKSGADPETIARAISAAIPAGFERRMKGQVELRVRGSGYEFGKTFKAIWEKYRRLGPVLPICLLIIEAAFGTMTVKAWDESFIAAAGSATIWLGVNYLAVMHVERELERMAAESSKIGAGMRAMKRVLARWKLAADTPLSRAGACATLLEAAEPKIP